MMFEKKIRKAAANMIYNDKKEKDIQLETMTDQQIINKLENDITKMKNREKIAAIVLISAGLARFFYKQGYDKCLSDIESVSVINRNSR